MMLVTVFGWAGEPVPSRQVPGASGSADRPCVLLQNGNVVFGTATTIGESVILTRQDSTQIRLPKAAVRFSAGSIRELHRFRTAGRRDSDLRTLVDDARWCLRYGLVREAAEDALRAQQLDPTHPQTEQVIRQVAAQLTALSRQGSRSVYPHSVAPGDVDPGSVRQASHEATVADAMTVDIESGSARLFMTRVQSILLNRCASCHARGGNNTTEFQLRSAKEAQWAPKRVAAENLLQVLAFVDKDAPLESEIRRRAIDGHGGRTKTLGEPGSTMMRQLDAWLGAVVEVSEVTEQSDAAPRSLRPVAPPNLEPVSSEPFPDQPGETTSPVSRMRRMPKVENPFDPAIFNRRHHGAIDVASKESDPR